MNEQHATRVALVVGAVAAGMYGPDCCIVATRALIEVLAYEGEQARAISVEAIASNAAAVPLIQSGVPVAEWPDEAWSVGIDTRVGQRPGRYPGHVVAVTGTRSTGGLLLDASSGQMARPARGMDVPIALVVPYEAHPEGIMTGAGDEAGTIVAYSERVGVHDYRSAPAWREAGKWRPVAGRAIRLLRGAGSPTA